MLEGVNAGNDDVAMSNGDIEVTGSIGDFGSEQWIYRRNQGYSRWSGEDYYESDTESMCQNFEGN